MERRPPSPGENQLPPVRELYPEEWMVSQPPAQRGEVPAPVHPPPALVRWSFVGYHPSIPTATSAVSAPMPQFLLPPNASHIVWYPVAYNTIPSSPHMTPHPQILGGPESSRVLTPSEAPAFRSPQDSPTLSHHDFSPEMHSSPTAHYQETPQTSPPQAREESPLPASATTPGQPQASPPPVRERRTVVVRFMEVAAHTAKCDECNRRNREGMIRCGACGWQCCRRCLNDRRGDRKHQSFTSMHAPGPSEEEGVAARALVDLGNTRSAPVPVRQGGGSRPTTDSEAGRQPKRARTARGSGNSGVDDSDETVSLPPLSEASPDDDYGRGDIFGYPRGRRNPPRGARPADMAE